MTQLDQAQQDYFKKLYESVDLGESGGVYKPFNKDDVFSQYANDPRTKGLIDKGGLYAKLGQKIPGAVSEAQAYLAPDERIYELYGQQSALSNRFNQMLPGLEEESSRLADLYQGSLKSQAAEEKKDVRAAASSRGLLYSGLRESAEQGKSAEAASKALEFRSKMAQDTSLMDMRNNLEMNAIQTAFDIQNLEQSRYNLLVHQQTIADAQKLSAYGQLFGGAGSLLGVGLGLGLGSGSSGGSDEVFD